jgi:hypothetical protein
MSSFKLPKRFDISLLRCPISLRHECLPFFCTSYKSENWRGMRSMVSRSYGDLYTFIGLVRRFLGDIRLSSCRGRRCSASGKVYSRKFRDNLDSQNLFSASGIIPFALVVQNRKAGLGTSTMLLLEEYIPTLGEGYLYYFRRDFAFFTDF